MKCHNRRRLPRDEYIQVRREVLQRDNWHCQNCGATTHLEVHHRQFRSQSGEDHPENLITLCRSCHQREHMLMTNESDERAFEELPDVGEGNTIDGETHPSLLGPDFRRLILHRNANSNSLSEYRAIAADLLDCMATAVCAYSADLVAGEIAIICEPHVPAKGLQWKLTISNPKTGELALSVSTQSLIRWSSSLRLASLSKGWDLETISWESNDKAEFLIDYPGEMQLSQVPGLDAVGLFERAACPSSVLVISCKDLEVQSRASAALQFLRMRKSEISH